jgi:cell division septation protein DedD
MRPGLVRNLDQIQEGDSNRGGSRLGTMVLVSIGGACLAFAAMAGVRRTTAAPPKPADPLGALVEKSKASAPALAASADLGGHDVTFPGMLSDSPRPTTALAAVQAERGAALAAPPGAPTMPPPPTDRLPVVPLPAQNVVAASPIVTRPRDALTQMARDASQPSGQLAEEGKPGLYQLQASSFRSEPEAIAFATALRQRGHRAHVEPAEILNRGTWYRVRVGPFRSQHEAAAYRAEFERKEHIVPFLVDPTKEKQVVARVTPAAEPRADKADKPDRAEKAEKGRGAKL